MAFKIMVVDDDAETRKNLQTIVELQGCVVVGLDNSTEATIYIDKEKFDGFFLDVAMPSLDGFQLAARVRRSPINRDAPIAMLTGGDDAAKSHTDHSAGVTYFLDPPITAEKVERLVNAMRGPMLRRKRRTARLPLSTEVQCVSGGQQFKASSLDVSQTGILLVECTSLQQGDEVDLQLRLPGADRDFNAHAKVLTKEGPDLAILTFSPLTPENQQLIEHFVEGVIQG